MPPFPRIVVEKSVLPISANPEDTEAAEEVLQIIDAEAQLLADKVRQLQLVRGRIEPTERTFNLNTNTIAGGQVFVRIGSGRYDRECVNRLLLEFEARVRVAVAARSRVEAA